MTATDASKATMAAILADPAVASLVKEWERGIVAAAALGNRVAIFDGRNIPVSAITLLTLRGFEARGVPTLTHPQTFQLEISW